MASIHYQRGNILKADVEALVNTVNTVGVMGKGIALQFRQAYPANYEAYRKACERGEVQIGRMFVFSTGQLRPSLIINFPTKQDWRGKARIEFIDKGLEDLVQVIRKHEIRSLAVPPLGCGNGGLDWADVRPRIEQALATIPGIDAQVYEPVGAPKPDEMPVKTKMPRLTPVRAALLALIKGYSLPGYRVTMLEVEKLAYLLQEAGEPMRLRFAKGEYGPYAEVLHHVLRDMEGHYLRGYGDRSGATLIRLAPDADEKTSAFLKHYPESLERLSLVADLISGFETPYGMELLATIHWTGNEDPKVQTDSDAAITAVRAWNERKRLMFRSEHIRFAWERLRAFNWLRGGLL